MCKLRSSCISNGSSRKNSGGGDDSSSSRSSSSSQGFRLRSDGLFFFRKKVQNIKKVLFDHR